MYCASDGGLMLAFGSADAEYSSVRLHVESSTASRSGCVTHHAAKASRVCSGVKASRSRADRLECLWSQPTIASRTVEFMRAIVDCGLRIADSRRRAPGCDGFPADSDRARCRAMRTRPVQLQGRRTKLGLDRQLCGPVAPRDI